MSHHKKLSKEDIIHRKNLQSIINDGRFRVAIFGSARIQPEDTIYQEISAFTKELAMNGYDIVTGGGPGAMEAASAGHHLAMEKRETARAIGINIELPFEQKPNMYLDVTESTTTFSARLDTFVLLSHIFVITPGGIGTLLELFYTWQLMQVGHICRSPIILWWVDYKELKSFIQKALVEKGFVREDEAELAIQVDTMEEVLKLIKTAHDANEQLGENACINIKQYLAGARRLGLC